MPQLTIRGIPAERIREVSQPMLEELAAICECGTDNFMIDCMETTSVFAGQRVDTYPFIEISWFERGTETRDRFAFALTKHIHAIGIEEVELAFKIYSEDAYYINGKRFNLL
ncbi:DUF1904 family protein [Paenibacillus sp. S3N08]|uniref:DUF1904 family protein n=2 Tax=Paenibacillus agricola TaxID=2716264 RepID=A0ABX0JJ33_9BACL|nr:DUF1904 family protein [Paenibacillus agricola]NHN34494.1 DUF1904 family protein [Paenibacillus agricola]